MLCSYLWRGISLGSHLDYVVYLHRLHWRYASSHQFKLKPIKLNSEDGLSRKASTSKSQRALD